MRPIDRTLQALGQVQSITERAVRDRRMHPQVLRDILTVIGDTLRALREDAGEWDADELQRRLDLLLALIDTETRSAAIAEERAAGRSVDWLSADETQEGQPAESPPSEAGAEEETPSEPAAKDDPEAHV